MTQNPFRHLGLTACALLVVACGPDVPAQTLGPVDGQELPAADTGRVAVGDVAPDFALETLNHGRLALSDYRGRKDIVLVFYRGHW